MVAVMDRLKVINPSKAQNVLDQLDYEIRERQKLQYQIRELLSQDA